MRIVLLSLAAGILLSQQDASHALIVNPQAANWTSEKGGSESFLLRQDAGTGALELFARYPGGHVFAPHWHDANERVILIEGRLALQHDGKPSYVEPGGFAYLPAKEVQRMSCVSQSRCSFYVYWDGNSKPHSASAN
jgi:quercetin dioxygenase-like cupin family protein